MTPGSAVDPDPAGAGGGDESEHLAHRVVMAAFVGPTVPEWLRRRLAAGLGSVCLFGSNLPTGRDADVRSLTDAIHAAGPQCLVAVDEEGGDVTRLDQWTGSDLPGNAALGAAGDPALTQAVAAALGRRLAAAGIDLIWLRTPISTPLRTTR